MRDAYEVLGVPRTASIEDIRRAYHRRARELHPDAHVDASDAEREAMGRTFAEVARAWEQLREPGRRANYDRMSNSGSDFSDSGARTSSVREAREVILQAVLESTSTLYPTIAEGSEGHEVLVLVVGLAMNALGELGDSGAESIDSEHRRAFEALCRATDKLNDEMLRALGGIGAFIPSSRKVYSAAEAAAVSIRERSSGTWASESSDLPIPLEKRLDAVNRSRRRIGDGRLPQRPKSFCQICGSGPAQRFSFDEQRGLILMRRRRTLAGHFCRSCALFGGRDMQAVTLTSGWWGVISAVVTPYFAINNGTQLLKASRMAVPQATTSSRFPPIEPGTPVTSRPGPWIGSIIAAVVIAVIILAMIASNSDRNSSNSSTSRQTLSWANGVCVSSNSGGSMVRPVPCSSLHQGKVVKVVANANQCPNSSESYVVYGPLTYCIDEDQ